MRDPSRPARSYLFVPASSPGLFAKADRGDADAIVLDLEDGVAVDRKEQARSVAAEHLAARTFTKPVWVRVNSGGRLDADLDALRPVTEAIAGLIVAKADVDSVRRAARLGVPLAPMLETAAAVLAAHEIAELSLVTTLHLGEVDLAADAGLRPGSDEAELAWARSQLVFSVRAAGRSAPPAPVNIEVADTEAFRLSTERAARQGFVGRVCIHPRQVAIANEVFTPSLEEVAAARVLVDDFDRAVAAGDGVFVGKDGRMVDEAVVRAARVTLALART